MLNPGVRVVERSLRREHKAKMKLGGVEVQSMGRMVLPGVG